MKYVLIPADDLQGFGGVEDQETGCVIMLVLSIIFVIVSAELLSWYFSQVSRHQNGPTMMPSRQSRSFSDISSDAELLKAKATKPKIEPETSK